MQINQQARVVELVYTTDLKSVAEMHVSSNLTARNPKLMNHKQLELLKKLVKLANNNPNEYEANSAARRVCKILEENKFELTTIYNDINKNKKSEFKSGQYASGIYNEVFNRMRQEYESHYYDNLRYGKWDFSETENRPKTTKRILKCNTCGQEKETIFLGYSELFECNDCQWSKYMNRRYDEHENK